MTEKEKVKVSRRKFLDYLLGGSAISVIVGAIYPAFRFLTPQEQETAIVSAVNLGPSSNIKPNSGQIFRFGKSQGYFSEIKKVNSTPFTQLVHICIASFNTIKRKNQSGVPAIMEDMISTDSIFPDHHPNRCHHYK